MTTAQITSEMKRLADPKRAKASLWFFKIGKGEYGEGDRFLGLSNPAQRRLAKKYRDLAIADIQILLKSPYHEHRQVALFILVEQFRKADEPTRKKIYAFYLRNTWRINNWDLVDRSAPHIVGMYLFDKPRKILYRLARSTNLWEKRIAILATSVFIREGEFDDTLKISQILLHDKHDLIHKAVGWMLREVGNKNLAAEERFLRKHVKAMPRTMLRYAIEKFPEKKRQAYMHT